MEQLKENYPRQDHQVKRHHSIDVFRALTMFFMIFVNDLSSVHHTPHWIEHVAASEDGLGFADTIFPIFLFIMGLSIPLAIGRRIYRGDSLISIGLYIVTRSFALIVMGFFHVNLENYNATAILPEKVWELFITVAFFLIWLDYPESLSRLARRVLVTCGVVILVVMAYLFKGGSPNNPEPLMTSWWGILGTIGWSYLVCAGIYLFSRGSRKWVAICLIVFVLMNAGMHAGLLDFRVWVIGDGSSVSLTMFGLIISIYYESKTNSGSYTRLWSTFSLTGLSMILLGIVIRPYTQGISKINSTPAWIFICTGIGILVFELIIWLVDVKGYKNWFKLIRPAGTSTLTSYLIPYAMVAVLTLSNFKYPGFFDTGSGGILRSFGIAFIVIMITGLLEKRMLRLKI